MTAFRTLTIPHDDTLQGRLTMDVFIADQWYVYKHRGSEEFYRVEVAISETLPLESKEKDLKDAFLVGRERVQEKVGKAAKQRRSWS